MIPSPARVSYDAGCVGSRGVKSGALDLPNLEGGYIVDLDGAQQCSGRVASRAVQARVGVLVLEGVRVGRIPEPLGRH